MAFSLERVVPWGRSLAEYQRMFALTPDDLRRRILGCADGPASFNVEATELGAQVISADPLYAFSSAEIRRQIEATYPTIIERVHANRDDFVWEQYATAEEMGQHRLVAMERFLTDLPAGRTRGRYVTAELPTLPFEAGAFELALCSNLLFLYSEQLGEKFHLDAVTELSRVAEEVRIFPLVALGGTPSRLVETVQRMIVQRGLQAQIETVSYEFQRGGNQMMRITR